MTLRVIVSFVIWYQSNEIRINFSYTNYPIFHDFPGKLVFSAVMKTRFFAVISLLVMAKEIEWWGLFVTYSRGYINRDCFRWVCDPADKRKGSGTDNRETRAKMQYFHNAETDENFIFIDNMNAKLISDNTKQNFVIDSKFDQNR
jgi:hypothetical protein